MSFGLGYMADGLLKGQERNRSWGLQKQQNQRAEDANKRANEAAERAVGLHQYDLQTAQSNAAIATNNASPENLGFTNATNAANADYAGHRVVDAGLQNQATQQQIELSAEQLTPQAKQYRDKVRQYESEASEWEHALRRTVHQKDQVKAQLETSKLIQDRDYRVLELIQNGDYYRAATLISAFSDNPHKGVVAVKQANDGNIIGYDQSGKVSVLYTKDQVDGLVASHQNKVAKDRKAPDVQMIEQPLIGVDGNQIVDDNGKVLMQKIPYAYNPKTDKWDPISTSENGLQISNDDVDPEFYELAWKQAVLQGKRTPEGFIKEYGYDPRKSAGSSDEEFDEGELTTGGLITNPNITSEKTTPRLGVDALKQL